MEFRIKKKRIDDLISLLIQLRESEFSNMFSMERYVGVMCDGHIYERNFDTFESFLFYSKIDTCETFKCIVGNAIKLDNSINLKNYFCYGNFDYKRWASDFFGINTSRFNCMKYSSVEFSEYWFLFSNVYSYFNNSIDGAIQRIEYYIEKIEEKGFFEFSDCIDFYKENKMYGILSFYVLNF